MNQPEHSVEQRVCRHCAEPMQSKARVCPHCGLTQGLHFEIPNDWVAIVVFLAIGAATVWFMNALFGGGRDFAKFRGQIVVLSSQITTAENMEKSRVVTGILTNRTPYEWQRLEFDVRFYGSNGVLMDAFTDSSYYTVGPHDEHSFSVPLYRRQLRPGIMSHTVSVAAARQPSFW